MIFVTVGTHEQAFDRLFRELDRLASVGSISDRLFCQLGYSAPIESGECVDFLTPRQMTEALQAATVVISHGGPGTILPVLAAKKPLVLVPRLAEHSEHVDNHQVRFCGRIATEHGHALVTSIGDLGPAIDAARAWTPRGGEAANTGEAVARLGALIHAARAR